MNGSYLGFLLKLTNRHTAQLRPIGASAIIVDVFIVPPNVRMSALAMSELTRPHALTQFDQNTSRSCLQTERAIRFDPIVLAS